MGCLIDLVKLTIVIFAVIGFVSVGGLDFIKESGFVRNSPNFQKFVETVRIKDEDMKKLKDNRSKADFSKIPKNKYKVDYQGSIFTSKTVLGTSLNSYQSMLYIGTEGILKTGKKEFASCSDKEVTELLGRVFDYQRVKLSNYQILKKGNMTLYAQDVPYYLYKADMQNGPYKKMNGMIAMIQEPGGQNALLVSFNFDEPFNLNEAKDFYSKIEFEK